MVITITDDNEAYKMWTHRHQDGYVLNLRSGGRPAMLHRAHCLHVFPAKPEYGDFTKKTKVCAERREDVEAWVRSHGHQIVLCSSCTV
ncbi:MAG TPA: hypothetical protein VFU81_08760 [Thermomicrobiales bacterium]|nr:hypothetical protein [Thermomicrobiales bacterium]